MTDIYFEKFEIKNKIQQEYPTKDFFFEIHALKRHCIINIRKAVDTLPKLLSLLVNVNIVIFDENA